VTVISDLVNIADSLMLVSSEAKFVFSIYDFGGDEKLDGTQLADCLRALDLTPSLKTITKLGGTTKKGLSSC
jgi:hypothetical protein